MNGAERSAPRGGFFVQVVPALLYAFAIFYGGLARVPKTASVDVSHFDKLLHALAFGFMQVVVLRAVRYEASKLSFRNQNALAFGLVVALGGLLELVQLMTAHRSAELLDWVADAAGAGAMALWLAWLARDRACAPSRDPEG